MWYEALRITMSRWELKWFVWKGCNKEDAKWCEARAYLWWSNHVVHLTLSYHKNFGSSFLTLCFKNYLFDTNFSACKTPRYICFFRACRIQIFWSPNVEMFYPHMYHQMAKLAIGHSAESYARIWKSQCVTYASTLRRGNHKDKQIQSGIRHGSVTVIVILHSITNYPVCSSVMITSMGVFVWCIGIVEVACLNSPGPPHERKRRAFGNPDRETWNGT